LATKSTRYVSDADAVALHIMLMRRMGEIRFGVFDRDLLESALSRPQHAADYEAADLCRQAATLCFGLIKNHPWVGGNKRTATILTDRFLYTNGIEVKSTAAETVEMALAVEADRWDIDEITKWYEQHTAPIFLQPE
jgi:death-on-curing protein